MRRKYKLTPFARFLFFLIFFLPISYVGLKIYNGEMTLNDLENLLKSDGPTDDSASTIEQGPDNSCDALLKLKDREIEVLKRRIVELEGN